MNISQTIFTLITINLLMVTVGFVIDDNDPETMTDRVTTQLSNNFNTFDLEWAKVQADDFWLTKFIKDLAVGVTTAINLAGLSFVIIGLISSNYLLPTIYLASATNEAVPVLRIIGYGSILYLWWVNIFSITHLFALLKGSKT